MRKVDKVDWSEPGYNKYTGPLNKAINSYQDIPGDVREKLIAAAEKREFSEIVVIDKTGIRGQKWEYINLRQMFFGSGIRAEKVERLYWEPGREERGFVYTVGGYSILVPFICRNVSRVDHQPLTSEPYIPPNPITPQTVNSVPEPSSLFLAGIAGVACFIFHRRNLIKGN